MSIITRLKPYIKWRFFLYFFAMIAGWPCVFSFMGWLPDWKINYMALAIVSILTMFVGRSKQLPPPILIIIFVQLLTFLLYFIIHSDSSYITRAVFLITTYALLSIQMARPKTEFIDTNVCFLTIQALMGGIGFILFLAGLLPVISTFIEFDGHTGQFYGLFTTTVSSDGLIRVAGFFDEPGAFAFWGVVALLFNKLFIGNKQIETILIVGLLSTLSMAFIIQTSLYLLLFYHKKKQNLLVYSILGLCILLMVASLSTELDNAIFGRFQVDAETGRLAGDNRTNHALTCFAIWQSSPIVGVGGNNLINIGRDMAKFVGANPFVTLAADGILGQLVLWLPLFYLFSMGKYRKEYRYTAIVLFAGFLQRPYDPTQLWYSLTMYMLLIEAYRQIHNYPGMNRSNIQYTKFIPTLW